MSGVTTKLTVPGARREGGLLPRMDLCSGLGRCKSVMGGGFLFGGGPCHATCGIFPNQGLSPCPLYQKRNLNRWTTREVPGQGWEGTEGRRGCWSVRVCAE